MLGYKRRHMSRNEVVDTTIFICMGLLRIKKNHINIEVHLLRREKRVNCWRWWKGEKHYGSIIS